MPNIDVLRVASTPAGPALTPSQKRFNALIKQIERARQLLATWSESIAAHRQAHGEVLAPLQAQLLVGHRRWVLALDLEIDQTHWTPSERATLRALLCEAAGELLAGRGDDPDIRALFDKHADVDYRTGRRERARLMKDLAEAMTGLDLGDDEGLDSEADLFQRLQQGLQGRVADEEAAAAGRAAKSARRPSAARQRREAEVQQATQSVREVYRKLASALHPDRETDERQREAKTALMQRVNRAYEAQDLLALLELQLQIEQIDARHIAQASDQRLRHYNKVLSEQLAELKDEVDQVRTRFCSEFGLDPGAPLDPRQLGPVLERTNRQWRAELEQQRRQLDLLDDVPATRRWLKRQRRRLRDEAAIDLDLPMF